MLRVWQARLILICYTLDFRETAPAAAFEEMYQGNVIGSVRSGLASGVPSDLRGLEYLHNKYGVSQMPFAPSSPYLDSIKSN